jgi:Superinfection immunity protein
VLSLTHWLLALAVLMICAAINFIPTFVAFARNHHRRVAILIFNLFLGWTGIGWVLAFVWALTPARPAAPT